MITKQQFIKAIKYCQKIDERESKFSDALREFQGNDDFLISFCSTMVSTILNWLGESMGLTEEQTSDIIFWWYYDLPEQGTCESDDECTIWNPDGSVMAIVRTPEDLYEYILSLTVTDYYIELQDNAIGFALNEIDKLIVTNSETANEDYEERNALLNLVRNRIQDNYFLKTKSQAGFGDLIRRDDD